MKKLKINLDELRNQLESIGADDAETFMAGKAIYRVDNPNEDFWLPKENEFQNFEFADTIDFYESSEDFDTDFDQGFGVTNYGGYGQEDFPSSMQFLQLWAEYSSANPSQDPYSHQCAAKVGKAIEDAYGYSFDNAYYTTNFGPVTSEGWPRGANSLADFLEDRMGPLPAGQKFTSKAAFDSSPYYSQQGLIFCKNLLNPTMPGLDHIDLYAGNGIAGSNYYDAEEIWFFPISNF